MLNQATKDHVINMLAAGAEVKKHEGGYINIIQDSENFVCFTAADEEDVEELLADYQIGNEAAARGSRLPEGIPPFKAALFMVTEGMDQAEADAVEREMEYLIYGQEGR